MWRIEAVAPNHRVMDVAARPPINARKSRRGDTSGRCLETEQKNPKLLSSVSNMSPRFAVDHNAATEKSSPFLLAPHSHS
jgi:hypothetical protein